MGIFFTNSSNLDEQETSFYDEGFDTDAYNETCLFMELMALPEEQRKAIAESEEAAILEAKGKISRKTIVRLNKKDDLDRRTSAAAYQMAKDNNDPLWGKLVLYMGKKNEFKKKILAKYAPRAARVAKQSQKDFLKQPAAKLLKTADLAATREKTEKK